MSTINDIIPIQVHLFTDTEPGSLVLVKVQQEDGTILASAMGYVLEDVASFVGDNLTISLRQILRDRLQAARRADGTIPNQG